MGGDGMGPMRQDQKWVALLEVYGAVSEADARALTKAVHDVLEKYKNDGKVKGWAVKFNATATKPAGDP
jgi:hypothetical protein